MTKGEDTLISIGPDAETIRAVERRRLAALVAADLAAAGELHSEDFQLITPLGQALTRDEYLGAIASGLLNYLAWDPHDIEVRQDGDSAVIRYQADLHVAVSGQEVPSALHWHTDYYERQAGQWRAVWSQATRVGAVPVASATLQPSSGLPRGDQ